MLTLIEKISGHKAVLVLDDEPGSDKAIDSYAHGFAPWMVAIRMVTEGVDIPRLRVGVYLSNVVQKLTFVQFIGRMVRQLPRETKIKEGDPAGEGGMCISPVTSGCGISPLRSSRKLLLPSICAKSSPAVREVAVAAMAAAIRLARFMALSGDNIVAGEMFSSDEIEVAEKLRSRWANLAEEQIVDMVKFLSALQRGSLTCAAAFSIRP